MKIKNIVKGFTLIELLVVITIIGILATGATSVYTSQIQKSRDSVRLTDIKAVQSGIEQYYQDNAVYPPKGLAFSGVKVYTPKLPQDPKSSQASATSVFDYLYNVDSDSNGIADQEYEISTTFEQAGNIDTKAGNDGGDDANRLELGINVGVRDTNIAMTATQIKNGINPTVPDYSCVGNGGSITESFNCYATKTGDNSHPMLIRSY